MRVSLVTDVPHDLVPRRVEHRVQSNRQLDDAKTSADVPAGARADLDEAPAHLFGDGAQLVARHRLEIRRRVNSVEDGHT